MDDAPPPSDLIREGVRLFNTGYFFEAHEVWEDAWRRERGEPRLFLQGLIQVAAGLHHLQNGNKTGALSLFRKAVEKLRGYPAHYLGIEAGILRAEVESIQARIEGTDSAPDIGIPRITQSNGPP